MERTKVSTNIFIKYRYFLLGAIVLCAALLRLWKLDVMPVSLFGDELDVGYQAYSVLKTGRDYSGNLLPLDFHSFAEFRTPLYLYSTVPSVALFGLNAFGIRFPAAFFGILTVPLFYFFVSQLLNKEKKMQYTTALFAAAILAISPWHIQYSRAAFEVTELLFFLLLGTYLFLISVEDRKRYLWLSAVCFALTPSIYSTAKFFTPLLVIVLIVLFRVQLLAQTKKRLLTAALACILVGIPVLLSTFFGQGSGRFGYISVFGDVALEQKVAEGRQLESQARGETGTEFSLTDKLFNNKFSVWSDAIAKNYFSAFSPEFLFISGDTNPRHTIEKMGVLYPIESVGLMFGVVYWATRKTKNKYLVFAWLLLSIIPAALTRDGGTHATRLIVMLPPLLILISGGFMFMFSLLTKRIRSVGFIIVIALYALSFFLYQHNYWYLNSIQSAKWWHDGWKTAIEETMNRADEYDSVLISTKGEPPWQFFATYSKYPIDKWHKGYPFQKHTIEGFGEISFIDKFSFGSPQTGSIYDLGKVLTPKMLYLATAQEVSVNLIAEPQRTPSDLVLLTSVSDTAGNPVFYLFTKKAI